MLPPATSIAIQYAYQNTHNGSSLRRLLADIFAFNVKFETLKMDISTLPREFVEDIVVINMKRLPLRLGDEEADFDRGTEKYYVQDTRPIRQSRVSQEGPKDKPADIAAEDEQVKSWGPFTVGKTSKHKKKGKRSRTDTAYEY